MESVFSLLNSICYGADLIRSPVNLLNGTTHKWVYVTILGALSISLAATIFQSSALFSFDFSFGNRTVDLVGGGTY